MSAVPTLITANIWKSFTSSVLTLFVMLMWCFIVFLHTLVYVCVCVCVCVYCVCTLQFSFYFIMCLAACLACRNKLCAWRHDMPSPLSSPRGRPAPRAPPSRCNVAVDSTPNTFSRSTLHLPHALRPRWVKRPGDLDLWPFDLEMVSESRVTWATSVSILVFLGLSVLELGPMYATDRRQMSDKSIA